LLEKSSFWRVLIPRLNNFTDKLYTQKVKISNKLEVTMI
jgi:hypothetical protein